MMDYEIEKSNISEDMKMKKIQESTKDIDLKRQLQD